MKDGMIYRYQKLDSAWMKDGDHTMDKEEQVYYAEEEGITKIFSGSIMMDNDNNQSDWHDEIPDLSMLMTLFRMTLDGQEIMNKN